MKGQKADDVATAGESNASPTEPAEKKSDQIEREAVVTPPQVEVTRPKRNNNKRSNKAAKKVQQEQQAELDAPAAASTPTQGAATATSTTEAPPAPASELEPQQQKAKAAKSKQQRRNKQKQKQQERKDDGAELQDQASIPPQNESRSVQETKGNDEPSFPAAQPKQPTAKEAEASLAKNGASDQGRKKPNGKQGKRARKDKAKPAPEAADAPVATAPHEDAPVDASAMKSSNDAPAASDEAPKADGAGGKFQRKGGRKQRPVTKQARGEASGPKVDADSAPSTAPVQANGGNPDAENRMPNSAPETAGDGKGGNGAARPKAGKGSFRKQRQFKGAKTSAQPKGAAEPANPAAGAGQGGKAGEGSAVPAKAAVPKQASGSDSKAAVVSGA
mmetsp:Transcript_16167/g.40980  ORF Transcript_16167/g.40980 Transcript_16167/m.40980 type:complete len:390 (-) Transcript_16167:1026-2195(-)